DRFGNELEPFLTLEVRNALTQHMVDEGDRECCGLITLSKGKYAYVRSENVHPEPEKSFRFDKQTNVDLSRKKSIVAYCHSHPNGPQVPSQHDTEKQDQIKKPAVIVARNPLTGVIDLFSFGDHLLEAPLDRRDFRYNVFDCLAALRSEVWQREGRYMPPAFSENGWWLVGYRNPAEVRDNLNLYERNFERYGYREFTVDLENSSSPYAPKIGDVLMMQLGAPVINHVAVYVGNNLIYHHRQDKLSGHTPIGYVLGAGYVRKWVRHEGMWDE
ncbi:MAG TPA: Mov34/MPN/PAD-1 family protein, partial [Nitrospira sp.]|nr:Mov34/MPN/PAD-1 family protein [Nitrospira sp.]